METTMTDAKELLEEAEEITENTENTDVSEDTSPEPDPCEGCEGNCDECEHAGKYSGEELEEQEKNEKKSEAPKKREKLGKGAIVIITALSLIAVIAVSLVIYSLDYYRARPEAEAVMADGVTLGNCTVFDGGGSIGLIFYPGGKVEHSAYAPLMKALSDSGITCVLVEMPMKLAVLDSDAWKDAMKLLPDIKEWYIGGHSLGGAMAASEANAEDFAGVVLLGAYATETVSVPALSIYGSLDGVMQMDKYSEGMKYLAAGVTEHVINGGNHAGFGSYGEQDGDGEALISGKEQIEKTAEAIIEFFNFPVPIPEL